MKENEKIPKYGALGREVTEMLGGDCFIIPVALGILGVNEAEEHLKSLPRTVKMVF